MKIHNYFILLWIGCLIGAFAIIPYAFSLQGKSLELLTINNLLLIGLQSAVIYAVIIGIGLYLAGKMNIPLLPFKKDFSFKNDLIMPAFLVAFLSALLIVLLDVLVFKLPLNNLAHKVPTVYALEASIYGGINEEILMRLFFLSLVAWLLSRIPSMMINASMWISIVISALIFGLGHLIIVPHITSLTGMLILRAIILNGIPGILFGWLYWKKSLETAMFSHFLTDIFLHVIIFKFL